MADIIGRLAQGNIEGSLVPESRDQNMGRTLSVISRRYLLPVSDGVAFSN